MPPPIDPDDFRAGDVLLHHTTGNMISRLIRLFDGSDYNHSSLLLGPTTLAEAATNGLRTQTVPDRIDGNDSWVDVYRLRTTPSDFGPVTNRAEHYLDRGEEFSYAQLVMLAFLSATRRITLPRGVRFLLRRILDGAAAVLIDILEAGREPMVCSELVFRCFNEALPGDDTYTLQVGPAEDALSLDEIAPELGQEWQEALRGARPRLGRPGPAPESLLVRVVLLREEEGWDPVRREALLPGGRSPEEVWSELRPAAEAFLDEVDGSGSDTDRVPVGELLRDSALLASLDRFVLAAASIGAGRTGADGGDPVSGRELRAAYRTVARGSYEFGTPRDLSECPQLELAGRYEPLGARRPA